MRKTPVESCVLNEDADHFPAILLKISIFFIHCGTKNQESGLSGIKRISRIPI